MMNVIFYCPKYFVFLSEYKLKISKEENKYSK